MAVVNMPWRQAARAVDDNKTQPTSASPYDEIAGAAQRVDAANAHLARCQQQHADAEREYDAARVALAQIVAKYGVRAFVDDRAQDA